jgi:tetratricopeptide (TPR) repeat protein
MLAGAVVLVTQAAPAANDDAFNSANNAFAQGKYAEATSGYETVIARQGYSAPVLFNLANAQVHSGQLGPAILNYERALVLEPNDPAIASNLQWALRKAGVTAPTPRWQHRAASVLSLNAWSVVAGAALVMLCVLAPLGGVLVKHRFALKGATALAGIVLIAAASALALRWSSLERAIVTAKDVAARVSPVTMAESLFHLTEGQAVCMVKSYGVFTLIKTGDGREGWVKNDDIARVLVSADSPTAPRA